MSYQPEQHTPECQAEHAAWQKAYAAFLAQWPHTCLDCHGTGEVQMNEDECDGCDSCIYAEKCPRCAADFVYQNANSRCAACGWEMLEDMLPYEPACACEFETRP